jgi:glutaredoxin 3
VTDIVIYTTRFCGYCVRAKSLLDARGLPYREVDVSRDHTKRRELVAETGQRTVPQIFIDGHSIGGYVELASLDRRGELPQLAS